MVATTDNQLTVIRDAFARYGGDQTIPAWLQPLRERAIQAFVERGFPTVREEDWKYTNLARVAERSANYLERGPGPARAPVPEEILAEIPRHRDWATVLFLGGQHRPDLSKIDALPPGCRVEALSSMATPRREAIISRLGARADVDTFQLAALNTAFLTDGLVLTVEAGTSVPSPVHVVFVSDDRPVSVQPRLLVQMQPGSRLNLVEHHLGDGSGLSNAITEIDCEAGAHLGYIKLQDMGRAAYHLAAQHVSLGRDSRFDAVHLDFGAELSRNDLIVGLNGEGAETNLFGLFLADGARHVDNHTQIDHHSPGAKSRELYRGIVDERGRGIFNGKIIVHPGADQTDAQLNNRNLLLSATAEVDTKPELEIYADDVKCGHGATTGQLDADAVFYLRSRGLSLDVARRLLISAFAREIVDRIPIVELREHVEPLLHDRLPGSAATAELL